MTNKPINAEKAVVKIGDILRSKKCSKLRVRVLSVWKPKNLPSEIFISVETINKNNQRDKRYWESWGGGSVANWEKESQTADSVLLCPEKREKIMKIEIEKMSDEFTKHHLRGLPVDAVIHHFTAKDKGEPHCHPFRFTSFIISGGYVEKVFQVNADGSWTSQLIHRLPKTSHVVEADHIHQIVELPAGECHTIILPEAKVKEPRFWQFNESGSRSRAWYEKDFIGEKS